MEHPFDDNAEAFQAYLLSLRGRLRLTQQQMADGLGMSLRAYSDLENGKAKVRLIHVMAAERLALRAGADRDPAMAPEGVRRDALKLVEATRGAPLQS